MKTLEQALREDPITQHAMKLTGLSFDEIMEVRLYLPENDPHNIGGWLVGYHPGSLWKHISEMRDFAILRWYYSPESRLPEFAEWKEAASNFVREAGKNTYVDDGAALQQMRKRERRPKVTAWIEKQLTRLPGAKSPDLWRAAPEWITDGIGYERFSKRVTAARKKLSGRK